MLRLRADYRTDAVGQSISLPDGSRAVLDADSAIAVHYSAGERRVDLLRGRAWFDVGHVGQPFRVAADGGLVEDIGTAFEVSLDRDGAGAAVTNGVIRVLSSEAGPDQTLRAGQRARWAPHGPIMRLADMIPTRVAAWRDGDIVLENVAVRAAVREISRYRTGPTLVLGDVDALPPITAIIRTDRADEGLRALADSANLEILSLPGGIAIVRPAQ